MPFKSEAQRITRSQWAIGAVIKGISADEYRNELNIGERDEDFKDKEISRIYKVFKQNTQLQTEDYMQDC